MQYRECINIIQFISIAEANPSCHERGVSEKRDISLIGYQKVHQKQPYKENSQWQTKIYSVEKMF